MKTIVFLGLFVLIVLAGLIVYRQSAFGGYSAFPAKNESFISGDWKVSNKILDAGSKSEKRSGELYFKNKRLEASSVNDFVETPWGRLYWIGKNIPVIEGWSPSPLSGEKSGVLRRPEEVVGTADCDVGILSEIAERLNAQTQLPPAKETTAVSGFWKLSVVVRNKGTMSEGVSGELYFKGIKLSSRTINDFIETPWGVLYWQGEGVEDGLALWHNWGWSASLRKGYPEGKRLQAPHKSN